MAIARHYSQLVCWQLANALRLETFTLTRRVPFCRDFRHQSQTEDAIDSVCRNIAEGFGCRSHDEFARFLEISRRSLNELMDSFRSAQFKGYVSAEDVAPIHALSKRLYPALSRLIAYLRRTPTPHTTANRRGQRPGT
jgi:four helix bundle protein